MAGHVVVMADPDDALMALQWVNCGTTPMTSAMATTTIPTIST